MKYSSFKRRIFIFIWLCLGKVDVTNWYCFGAPAVKIISSTQTCFLKIWKEKKTVAKTSRCLSLALIWTLFDYCLMMFETAIMWFWVDFALLAVSARQHPLFIPGTNNKKSKRNAPLVVSMVSWGCAVHCMAGWGLSFTVILLFCSSIIVHISQVLEGLLSLFNQHFSEHDLDIKHRLNIECEYIIELKVTVIRV